MLLGDIIERAGGKPYRSFISSHCMVPDSRSMVQQKEERRVLDGI
jgi:hypothetical protein